MDNSAISENAAAGLAIIATVVFATVIFSILSGLFSGTESLVEKSSFDVNVVLGMGADGNLDVPVIRLSYEKGAPLPVNRTAITLIDPNRKSHRVQAGVLVDGIIERGDVWYIFYYDHEEPGASDYWYTDEPEMVFSTAYHSGVEPFMPPGTWRLVLEDLQNRERLIDLSLDL
ncbi:MAG: hypothetical protein GKC04_06030 [Methanomicrobiales archaeon]|nr:hypothetical protein [Methanomicrobiales archaeon]